MHKKMPINRNRVREEQEQKRLFKMGICPDGRLVADVNLDSRGIWKSILEADILCDQLSVNDYGYKANATDTNFQDYSGDGKIGVDDILYQLWCDQKS